MFDSEPKYKLNSGSSTIAIDLDSFKVTPFLPKEVNGLKVYIARTLSRNDLDFDKNILNKGLTYFSEQINESEKYFGQTPAALLNSISVFPTATLEANANGPDVIKVSYGTLMLSSPQLRIIARHELAHKLDSKLGRALCAGELLKVYNEIEKNGSVTKDCGGAIVDKDGSRGPDFFHQLNEKNFFREIGAFGGHVEDGHDEFLASLISSLSDVNSGAEWIGKIQSKTPEFQKYYRKSIDALASNIEALQKRGLLPEEFGLLSDIKRAQSLLGS